MLILRVLWATCAVVLLSGPGRAAVLVVDAAAGPFTSIQAAVNAAADGDVLLVRNGTYAGFTVGDKSLVIAAHPNAGFDDVKVQGGVHISSLTSNKTVELTFLTVFGKAATSANDPASIGLLVDSCLGHVRVQACKLRGAPGKNQFNAGQGNPGARVENSADVMFIGSQIYAAYADNEDCNDPSSIGGRGGDGLQVVNAGVAVYDSLVEGGRGGEGCMMGGDGGDGGRIQGGTVFSSNTQWLGGDGNAAIEFFCIPTYVGGTGGAGLRLDNGSLTRLLGGVVEGGAGGPAFLCNGPGAPGVVLAGTDVPTVLPGAPRAFNLTKSAKEGQSVLLQFVGAPGETILLFLSGTTNATYLDPYLGVFALGFPVVGPLAAGTIPGSGVQQFTVPLPALPAGVLGAQVYVQPFFQGPTGARLGSPAHLAIFNAGL